ncbi:MAG: aminotransferase, partial [Pseudorhodobacter sp.]|nr:aminotransferase [Pseudorhodobacter sp.]
LGGEEMEKPGWTRLNLSCLLDDSKAETIISAVSNLALAPHPHAEAYLCDTATARFKPLAAA